jgi:hypothetical protein
MLLNLQPQKLIYKVVGIYINVIIPTFLNDFELVYMFFANLSIL